MARAGAGRAWLASRRATPSPRARAPDPAHPPWVANEAGACTPLVGETKNDDVPAAVRFEAYETLLEGYSPSARSWPPFPPRCAAPARARRSSTATARKNYGITHLIVGRDHAGVGRYYGPYEAQQIFDRFDRDEIGVAPLLFEPTFYCHACDTLASSRTCPRQAPAGAVGHARARGAAGRRTPSRHVRARGGGGAARALRARERQTDTAMARRPRNPPRAPRRVAATSSGSPASPAPASRRSPRPSRPASPTSGRSRSWTGTRSAPTCRRASVSAGRTATRTSCGSATSPACWPGTGWRSSLPPSRPTARSATRCGGWPRPTGFPSSRCSRARRSKP